MADPSSVLAYLAELAPRSRRSSRVVVSRRRDLVHLGWVDPAVGLGLSAEEEGGLRIGRSEAMDRLAAADRLHADEHLLRFGWLFLTGSVTEESGERRRFLTPLVSASVELDRGLGGYRVVPVGDAQVDDALVTAPVAEVLEDEIGSLLTIAGPEPPDHPVMSRYVGFKTWVREFCSAAGPLAPDPVHEDSDPWVLRTQPTLLLTLGAALYLERDAEAPTVRSDLETWAERDLGDSALASLYGSEPSDADTSQVAIEPSSVRSSFALNRGQREAIARSRGEGVTVVSGPPGTGKTHLVAALAVDEVSRGKAVLVATQTEHAASVVSDFLSRHPGPRFVRFGDKQHREQVAAELAAGTVTEYAGLEDDQLAEQFENTSRRYARAHNRIVRLLAAEVGFSAGLRNRQALAGAVSMAPGVVDESVDLEEARKLLQMSKSTTGLFADRRRERAEASLRSMVAADEHAGLDEIEEAVALGAAERRVTRGLKNGGLTLAADWSELVDAESAWRAQLGLMAEKERRTRDNSNRVSTRAVSALATALRSGRLKRRSALAELQADHFLDVLPLWVGTVREVDDTLPAEPAMFDVVIFDEASQIDQLRAAPALARAERCVVVGDTRQLRHVSFIADDAVAAAAFDVGIPPESAAQLDVRRNSLFDAAVAVAPVTKLVEHFRSVPHLIGFSNRWFYGNELALMTQHPATETKDAIHIRSVSGRRSSLGVNETEVDAVLRELRLMLAAGASSIGLMSPFRAQADAIEEAVLETFHPEELEKGNVSIGTVHAFQGNERDVVILSLALGPDDLGRSLSFVEDAHLFNVMVTRAREQLIVVTSLVEDALPSGLLGDYLRWSHTPPWPVQGAEPATSWVAELARAIADYRLRVVPDYPVAGYTIDLAVGEGRRAIGVECGVYENDPKRHVERHLDLVRAGWELHDAFESRWLSQPETAVDEIAQRFLEEAVAQTQPTRSEGQ